MRLFLIRHGKTDVHLESRRQAPDSPLGEYGLDQAKKVAKRFVGLKIDKILSSSWPRALQTAQVISEEIGVPVEVNSELREQEKSKTLDNILDSSEINKKFERERSESAERLDFNWKFENSGESLNETLMRARMVSNNLASDYKNLNVIVVSHGIFIAALLTSMIFGIDSDKRSIISFFKAFRQHNTGVTVVEYNEEKGYWSLLCLNDYSHLFDLAKQI